MSQHAPEPNENTVLSIANLNDLRDSFEQMAGDLENTDANNIMNLGDFERKLRLGFNDAGGTDRLPITLKEWLMAVDGMEKNFGHEAERGADYPDATKAAIHEALALFKADIKAAAALEATRRKRSDQSPD